MGKTIILLIFSGVALFSIKYYGLNNIGLPNVMLYNGKVICVSAQIEDNKLRDDFNCKKTLEETGKTDDGDSEYWWVNSGAYLIQKGGVAMTVQDELEPDSKWQMKYKDYNSEETDDGYHPQNIFRLVTRSKWTDFTQEVSYKINKYHLSDSVHRSESNGLLLFNRYQDGDNLYYTGLRVDGAAVIKKKYRGEYFTMAYVPVIEGKYDRDNNPNLIQVGEWIGIRSELANLENGQVKISLYIKMSIESDWELAAEAIDDGVAFGGDAITAEGYAGIRTDFMDVEFDNYKIENRSE